jgi:hypothetical protein
MHNETHRITSICAMTLARLLISKLYKLDNYTKQAAIVGFITGLEPIFGVINVCLPFFPVVVSHFSSSAATYLSHSRFSKNNNTSTKGSREADRRSGIRADSSGKFRAIESVNLVPFEVPGKAFISAGRSDSEEIDIGRDWAHPSTQNKIMVRKDISVERSVF